MLSIFVYLGFPLALPSRYHQGPPAVSYLGALPFDRLVNADIIMNLMQLRNQVKVMVSKTQFHVRLYGKLLFFILVLSISCSWDIPPHIESKLVPPHTVLQMVPIYTYKIVNTFPHDPEAFTQGLVFENGILYEGTGLYGDSSIRKVDLETGKVFQIYSLPKQYYGEGITVYKSAIIQLTLESNKGFVYDKNNFDLLREFSYLTQGWGITHDSDHIIMSDGTSTLYLLNPETFNKIGQIEVRDNNVPLKMINELEYVNGKIYANIWKTDNIAIIDPQNGRVTGWINLSGLLGTREYGKPIDVLNGIAYDANTDRLFVTGKLWPLLFEIKLVAR
jgi:glutamine cyclotransferase